MLIKITTCLLLASFFIPYVIYLKSGRKNAKTMLVSNLVMYFSTMVIASVFMFMGVFAEPAAEAASANGLGYLAAGIATGLATVGAGIAVGAAASAALGAISENEKIFGKALIFVALAEGVALYGLLISFMILNKLG